MVQKQALPLRTAATGRSRRNEIRQSEPFVEEHKKSIYSYLVRSVLPWHRDCLFFGSGRPARPFYVHSRPMHPSVEAPRRRRRLEAQ